MKIATHSAVPVYTVSGGDTSRKIPEWLARKRKRSLKNDPEYANRIELLQDFEFQEASSCVRVSEDGEWLMSTGTYKPQIHVHYLPHLALSFSRHTDSLNQTFELLSSDYSKSVHLQSDRTIEIHTAGGRHHTTRIPRYGRDIKIDRYNAEALIPSAGTNEDGNGEVFRLNLEQGRFMKSYAVDIGGVEGAAIDGASLQGGVNAGSINCAAVAEASHNLLAFGTSIGTTEFWDPRARSRIAILTAPATQSVVTSDDFQTRSSRNEITALQFHPSGLTFAAGDSAGMIRLYDLRSPVPLLKKDQGYEFPIQTLKFLTSYGSSNRTSHLSADPKILSADKRIIKIWSSEDGAPWTSVEPSVDLHCVEWCRDSGMILTANEGQQQHSFFIPQLGPAPKWCSFLDNVVEEMAEDENDPAAYAAGGALRSGEIYDNYKFLSIPQLKALNLDHLVGTTSLLRPYMHGYFVSQQLYEEARLISQPDLWQEQRQKTIRERIEKERESRIRGNKSQYDKVKVNKALAKKLTEREEKNERRKAKRALEKGVQNEADLPRDGVEAEVTAKAKETQNTAPRLLNDPRFSALFTDEDFQVDETSTAYQAANPAGVPRAASVSPDADPARRLTAVEREELSEGNNRSDSEMDGSSSDGESSAEDEKIRRDTTANSWSSNTISKSSYAQQPPARRREPEMRIVPSAGQRAHMSGAHGNKQKSFGGRAAGLSYSPRSKGGSGGFAPDRVVGSKQMRFVPSSFKNKGRRGGRGDGSASTAKSQLRKRRSASGNVFRRM